MDVIIDYESIERIGRDITHCTLSNPLGGKYSKAYNLAVEECYRAYDEGIQKAIKSFIKKPNEKAIETYPTTVRADKLIELIEDKQAKTKINTNYGHGILAGLTEAKDIVYRLILEEKNDVQ